MVNESMVRTNLHRRVEAVQRVYVQLLCIVFKLLRCVNFKKMITAIYAHAVFCVSQKVMMVDIHINQT